VYVVLAEMQTGMSGAVRKVDKGYAAIPHDELQGWCERGRGSRCGREGRRGEDNANDYAERPGFLGASRRPGDGAM